jgi:hypothetical protein
MADLRKRFVEDYAGGLLNIARQELSTTGEVLAQDGLTSSGTLFVEDGTGTKSGLKLGVSLAEAIDPTTELGVVNVRFADRTYAKIRDLKIFSTAIASAQAALSEASSTSLSNIETTLQFLEDDITSVSENFQKNLATSQEELQTVSLGQKSLEDKVSTSDASLQTLTFRVEALESSKTSALKIASIATSLNSFYYTGTVTVANAIVTGSSTLFDSELDVGDSFVAITSTGEEVEFTVASFDTTSPNTSMTVTPTNKTVTAGARFKRNQNLDLKRKINEIISTLKSLNIIV